MEAKLSRILRGDSDSAYIRTLASVGSLCINNEASGPSGCSFERRNIDSWYISALRILRLMLEPKTRSEYLPRHMTVSKWDCQAKMGHCGHWEKVVALQVKIMQCTLPLRFEVSIINLEALKRIVVRNPLSASSVVRAL
ncbi:hypothetical protein LENED_005051 [Lentinula edodes]|uniref:Uncharacterized protein n=1 Tax=Lentinula edodes TaxID=5353 RepID=A0A1Q3E820_LENED|nr:hypothetical protein LENED_005051 [Lentinula edodes]